MKQKWQFELDMSIDDKMWMSIFNVCFNSSDNSLQWFQLKLVCRIFPTKEYLKKINIVNTAECGYCQESETILHMFVWGPRWQSGNTLASHLCGRGSIPVMAVSGKAGSCLPLVGSLQYTTLANSMYWFPLPFQLPVVI